jgi:hypothetical protein
LIIIRVFVSVRIESLAKFVGWIATGIGFIEKIIKPLDNFKNQNWWLKDSIDAVMHPLSNYIDKLQLLNKLLSGGGSPLTQGQMQNQYNLVVKPYYQGKAQGGIIEKFASGGIRGQDNIPAMLSEGEMVLNKAQQKNLFKMINGGGGSSIVIQGDVVVDNESRLDEWVRKIELALGSRSNLELRGA